MVAAICGVGIGAADALAQASSASGGASGWTTTANSEVRYFSSRKSQGATASQLFLPFAVQFAGRPDPDWKVSFLVRSGYISSRQNNGTVSSSASVLTDTSVTPTVSYLGINGMTPTLSVPMNLPTASGSASSTSTQSKSKTDGDIVPAPTFGEGFNIGPTLSNNFNISESTVLGLGIGYTSRGAFDQGTQTGVSRFNPGDVTTVNVTLGYRGERLSLQGSAAYAMESTTYQDGAPLYRAGDRVIMGLKAGYALTENWSARAAVNYSHFTANEVPAAAGLSSLVREAFNSNSDVTQVNLDLNYRADRFSIGPTLTYVYRDRNGYNPNTFQFLPAKSSWGVGANGSYQISSAMTLNTSVQRIWVRENESPAKLDALNALIPGSGIPQAATDIWLLSIGGSYKF